MVKINSFR